MLLKRYKNTGSELEFLKSLWGLGTAEEEGYRTGPPDYIGWRNSFLGIDSGAPYTFKNTDSGYIDSLELIPGLLTPTIAATSTADYWPMRKA